MLTWQEILSPSRVLPNDNAKSLSSLKSRFTNTNGIIDPDKLIRANKAFLQTAYQLNCKNEMVQDWLSFLSMMISRWLRHENMSSEQISLLFSRCLTPLIFINGKELLPFPNLGHAKVLSVFYSLRQFEPLAMTCLASPYSKITAELTLYQQEHSWFEWYLSLISPLSYPVSQNLKQDYLDKISVLLIGTPVSSIKNYLKNERVLEADANG